MLGKNGGKLYHFCRICRKDSKPSKMNQHYTRNHCKKLDKTRYGWVLISDGEQKQVERLHLLLADLDLKKDGEIYAYDDRTVRAAFASPKAKLELKINPEYVQSKYAGDLLKRRTQVWNLDMEHLQVARRKAKVSAKFPNYFCISSLKVFQGLLDLIEDMRSRGYSKSKLDIDTDLRPFIERFMPEKEELACFYIASEFLKYKISKKNCSLSNRRKLSECILGCS